MDLKNKKNAIEGVHTKSPGLQRVRADYCIRHSCRRDKCSLHCDSVFNRDYDSHNNPLVPAVIRGDFLQIHYYVPTKKIGDGQILATDHTCATALAPAPPSLCPHRARKAESTPCSIEFRHAGFRAQTPDGNRRDSVSRLFSTDKSNADLRMRRRHKMRPPSSYRMESSACRATIMVLKDHSSTRPGNDRAHGRVRRGPYPGHFRLLQP